MTDETEQQQPEPQGAAGEAAKGMQHLASGNEMNPITIMMMILVS